jgi:hypothetical protein
MFCFSWELVLQRRRTFSTLGWACGKRLEELIELHRRRVRDVTIGDSENSEIPPDGQEAK